MKNLLVFLAVILLLAGVAMKYANEFPVLDETVKEKWSQVQNQYKRRADLIPNLVKTVQGYASHEQSVFKEVTEARSKASAVTIDVSSIDDPTKLKEFEAAQNSLGGALSRLMAISESYPQLKADQNFLALQSQLEGTENRISVKDYNVALRKIPGKFIAAALYPELKPRATFEASVTEQNAPEVSFAK